MRSRVAILLLVLSFSQSMAQEDAIQLKIDSLLALITPNTSDTAKANKKNKNIIFNNYLNNLEKKTIDINYNNKNIYHNSNINQKSNSPVMIKIKSNIINHANNKADFKIECFPQLFLTK